MSNEITQNSSFNEDNVFRIEGFSLLQFLFYSHLTVTESKYMCDLIYSSNLRYNITSSVLTKESFFAFLD